MPATETTEQETLVARASARHVRVTPQKARRIVDMIRGKDTQTAIATLQFAPQGAAEPTLKVLQSAIANLRVKADEAGEAFDPQLHQAMFGAFRQAVSTAEEGASVCFAAAIGADGHDDSPPDPNLVDRAVDA